MQWGGDLVGTRMPNMFVFKIHIGVTLHIFNSFLKESNLIGILKIFYEF